MKQKNVSVIVNPVSGTDLPLVSLLNEAFVKEDIRWNLQVTNKGDDVVKLTKSALKQKPDVLYVLGGDGTVCDVVEGLENSKVPLAILPAGTANIMAKEFGIPLDLVQALHGFVRSRGEIKKVTSCRCNDDPFSLRLSIGVLAGMVSKSTRKKKEQLGALAYPLSALESFRDSSPQIFRFSVDGQDIEAEGMSLVINNFGNIGLPGVSFLPEIDPTDEYLDVILLQAQDLLSLISLAKTTLADKSASEQLQHWRAKKVKVTLPEKTLVIQDDIQVQLKTFTAKTTKNSVRCLLPRL